MTKFDHIAIIFNPNSTGPAPEKATELYKKLSPDFLELVKIYPTKYKRHGEEVAIRLTKKYHRPMIISVSGDGGYHEVINGALAASSPKHRPVCAVEAAGNANDHYRAVRTGDLYEKIKAGNIQKIDLLLMEAKQSKTVLSRYAHSYIGLGVTPQIARELNRHKLNRWREALILISTFKNLKPFKINNESGQTQLLDSLLFANIHIMAKVLKVSPDSKLRSGRFDVIAYKHTNKPVLMWRFIKTAIVGQRDNKKVECYKFKTLKKEPIQLDGELLELGRGAEVVIRLAPKALETM